MGRPPERLLTNPGKFVRLGPGEGDTVTVEANDPLVNEWGLYVTVEPESFRDMAGGDAELIWGVRMTVLPNFDSANFVYWRPSNSYERKLIPVTGVALAIHGQRVNVQFKRDKTIFTAGTMVLMAALIPRLPCASVDVQNGTTSAAVPFSATLPALSRSVTFVTDFTPGDILFFRTPSESLIVPLAITPDLLLRPIPIPKMAYALRYATPGPAKDIIAMFQTSM
jgi:hypothetical protein